MKKPKLIDVVHAVAAWEAVAEWEAISGITKRDQETDSVFLYTQTMARDEERVVEENIVPRPLVPRLT